MSTGGITEGIPHFDVKITEDNVDKMAKMLIRHIKKDWDANSLCRKDFNDGFTNKLVGYYQKKYAKNTSEIVLIRINGEKTELMINRDKELRNIEEFSKNHTSVSLYATYSNGYCYKYIEGKTLTREDFTKKDILKLSADYLAKVHTTKVSDNYINHHKMESTIFMSIREFITHMPEKFSSAEMQLRYEKEVPTVARLRHEVDTLQHAVSKLKNLSITYCHNDLHPGNCIYDENEDEIFGIDYEYGGPNYSAFDIANHFNELCGVADFDSSFYPKKETQLWWLKAYLEKINEAPVPEEIVSEWYKQVEHMSLVAHLFWGVWSFIQACYSQIDFDFLDYGIVRLNEYYKRKKEVLGNSRNGFIS